MNGYVHTPTDDEVRRAVTSFEFAWMDGGVAFDRWLAAHDAAIAAQAKAEAWDEVIARLDIGTPYMVDEKYVAGATWVRNQIDDVLRARAASIEGMENE